MRVIERAGRPVAASPEKRYEVTRFTNHLAGESSPYLRQHRHNPVDWYPWGREALERAAREDRPIFLSVGYSACHWCHVMAHESFEDPVTAAYLNEHFVCIKVDREERPDLDALYMRSVMLMTGSGGWPLTVFLTPSRRPFYGGTYFPKAPRYGMPSFMQVLEGAVHAFRDRRKDLEGSAERVTAAVSESFSGPPPAGVDPAETVERALAEILSRFDDAEGGFGRGPKFPQPPLLAFLMEESLRREDGGLMDKVRLTLRKMAAGGVRDQVGGGFHRYSVDGQWRVPHYEKMLYDNAQLASLYFRAFAATGDGDFRSVAERVLEDVDATMAAGGGGYVAALDADSGGGEGLFYLWSREEILRVLGPVRGGRLARLYGIGDGDELADRTPHLVAAPGEFARREGLDGETFEREVSQGLEELRAARETRPHPGVDTKVLTDWNALAATAYLDGFAATDSASLLEKGIEALDLIWDRCWDGRMLKHVWGVGGASVDGLLSDYAYLAAAEWRAFELTGDPQRLDRVQTLVDAVFAGFLDPGTGRLYDSPVSSSGELITPVRDPDDGVMPSPAGVLARVLWNLERLTDDASARSRLDDLLHAESGQLASAPGVRPSLAALALSRSLPRIDVVVACESLQRGLPLLAGAWKVAFPGLLVLPLPADRMDQSRAQALALFEGRHTSEGCRAFVCVAGTCGLPVSEPEALREALQKAVRRVRKAAEPAAGS